VASEVAYLTAIERREILARVLGTAGKQLSVIAGTSANNPAEVRRLIEEGAELGASAVLVAVPAESYVDPGRLLPFFLEATRGCLIPVVVQDLEFNGPGLNLDQMRMLTEALPSLAGWKIETVPSGPKYTAVREAFGEDCHISGGWAVPQLIEALDRRVDAMIPEASMVRVYQAIRKRYLSGNREGAVQLFRRLLPLLSFTNQEIRTSIAFFKRLLVRKRIFATDAMRWPGFAWDSYNGQIAEELIELYLELERNGL
jgi:4-hydroxy-tetrahydrodipicolinate synthase